MTQTQGFAEVNGTKLYYEVTGVGEPLVFLHSGILHSDMWDDQVEAFAKSYQVIRYDFPSHGRSAKAVVPFDDRQDLFDLLHFLGLEQVHLVTCSYGGMTAIDFTLDHPEKVRSLTLACASLSGHSSNLEDVNSQGTLQAYEHLLRGEMADAVEILVQLPMWRLNDPVAQQRMKEMFSTSTFPQWLQSDLLIRPKAPGAQRLAEIQKPTLLIQGDRDNNVILEISDLLLNSITGAERVIFSDCGHLPNMEAPEQFNRVVLDFLNRNRI